ncbi:hypothetical protein IWQ60_009648 [Tieghemiomyces parasiticus]|uniref:Pentatricopeptide repeat-containing protein n=1 Tax=Tieghemiomyces parasiticus TaxID=78921 RepID=A0A9W8DJJ9_9FUNG|nr:hypothetical protein IWQ60_009648 [Tieghemiomyces parasiticus]
MLSRTQILNPFLIRPLRPAKPCVPTLAPPERPADPAPWVRTGRQFVRGALAAANQPTSSSLLSTSPRLVLSRLVENCHHTGSVVLLDRLLVLAERHGVVPQKLAFDRALDTYLRAGRPAAAWRVWQRWREAGKPVTSFAVHTLLRHLTAARDGRRIRALAADLPTLPGITVGVPTCNLLIAALGRVGELNYVHHVFQFLRAGPGPDRATYTVIANALAEAEAPAAIVHSYCVLAERERGWTWDAELYVAFVCAYARGGAADRAVALYRALRHQELPIASPGITRLVMALGHTGQLDLVLRLIDDLPGPVDGPSDTVSPLPSLALPHLGAALHVSLVRRVHHPIPGLLRRVTAHGFSLTTPLVNLLIRYGVQTRRDGLVGSAPELLQRHRLIPDPSTVFNLVLAHCRSNAPERAAAYLQPGAAVGKSTLDLLLHAAATRSSHADLGRSLVARFAPALATCGERTACLLLNLALSVRTVGPLQPYLADLSERPWTSGHFYAVMIQAGEALQWPDLSASWVQRALLTGAHRYHAGLALAVARRAADGQLPAIHLHDVARAPVTLTPGLTATLLYGLVRHGDAAAGWDVWRRWTAPADPPLSAIVLVAFLYLALGTGRGAAVAQLAHQPQYRSLLAQPVVWERLLLLCARDGRCDVVDSVLSNVLPQFDIRLTEAASQRLWSVVRDSTSRRLVRKPASDVRPLV